MRFFLKQFTVGVLNASFDLAALVLVGVAAFFGCEMVLAPLASFVVLAPFGSLHCGGGFWLVWPPSEFNFFGVYGGVNFLTEVLVGPSFWRPSAQ